MLSSSVPQTEPLFGNEYILGLSKPPLQLPDLGLGGLDAFVLIADLGLDDSFLRPDNPLV